MRSVWSAGGNDFPGARDDYASSCDVAALDQALSDFRDDWDLIIALVSSDVFDLTREYFVVQEVWGEPRTYGFTVSYLW